MSVDEERKVGMGARVDAAEGGAHPFLTAHFLTPPPVFVFNPRHSRRPWVHSLLVQKGGGACCFPSVSRSLSVATRTISNILDPPRGEAVVVAVYSTVLPSLLPCAQLCVANAAPRGSVTLTCVHAIIPRSSAQGASTLSFTPPPTTGYRSTASYQSARASVRNHSPSFFLLYQK